MRKSVWSEALLPSRSTAKLTASDFRPFCAAAIQRGGGVFGQLFDSQGKPILEKDGSPRISDDNDHSTLLDVHGKVFMMSQFESRPGAFYLTE